jgi:hypothetical protein
MTKINITETAKDFQDYPSESKAHLIEANLGVDVDFGYHAPLTGKKHKILLEEDNNTEPY